VANQRPALLCYSKQKIAQFPKLSVTFQIVISDCLRLCAAGLRSQTALAAENLFLRKQLAVFREREKKAAATTAGVCSIFRLAQRFGDRQTGHRDRLASRCVPAILALEVETGRATSKGGNEALDPAHGSRPPSPLPPLVDISYRGCVKPHSFHSFSQTQIP